jgi:hypothetical protein
LVKYHPPPHGYKKNADYASPIHVIEAVKQNKETSHKHDCSPKKGKPMSDSPKWTDIAIVLLTCVIAGAAIFQWREMHTGATDTHDLAVAAKTQAEAAKAQADATKIQAENTKTIAESAKSQADTLQTTLTSNRLQFRSEERPYLVATPGGCFNDPTDPTGVRTIVIANPQPDGGAQLCMQVTFHNSGRSPAIDTGGTNIVHKIGRTDEVRKIVSAYTPEYLPGHGSILVAGEGIVPGSKITTLTKEQLTGIMNGTWEAYMVGAMRYRDMFSPKIAPYETTYCVRLNPKGMAFADCFFPPPAFGNAIK